MKIKITITDDMGKEYEGNIELESKNSKNTSVVNKSSLKQTNVYKGLVGGIKLLVDDGFFKTLKTAKEVFNELQKEGYFYSISSVDRSLRRDYVLIKKILTRMKDNGVWKYVIRK